MAVDGNLIFVADVVVVFECKEDQDDEELFECFGDLPSVDAAFEVYSLYTYTKRVRRWIMDRRDARILWCLMSTS